MPIAADDHAADDHQAIPFDEPQADQAHGEPEGDLTHEGRREEQPQGQNQEHRTHEPHDERRIEKGHARAGNALQPAKGRHRPPDRPFHIRARDRAVQELARQPGRFPAEDDLDRRPAPAAGRRRAGSAAAWAGSWAARAGR